MTGVVSACDVAPAGAGTEAGAVGGVSPGAPTVSGAGVGTGAVGSGSGVPVVAGRSPMAGTLDTVSAAGVLPVAPLDGAGVP